MSKKIKSLFVIGAGSGGVRAARLAKKHIDKVYLAESWKIGGTCVNRGCVPKKLFVHASSYLDLVKMSNSFGWNFDPTNFEHNWNDLVKRVDSEISRLNDIYNNLIMQAGVEYIQDLARLHQNEATGKTEVIIGNKNYKPDRIILAPGSKVFLPNIKGIELANTSDDFFLLKKRPRDVIVLGGGYIALELAVILANFNTKVTVINRSDRYLRSFDKVSVDKLLEILKLSNITFISNQQIEHIVKKNDRLEVKTNKQTIKTKSVIAAFGRIPLIEDLDLAAAGVELEKDGSIKVDGNFRTSNKNVYAIGDAVSTSTKTKQLTPVAIKQAKELIGNWFSGLQLGGFNYNLIASAIFTKPPLAFVGMSYQEAVDEYGDKIDVYQSQFTPLTKVLANTNAEARLKNQAFIRMIVDKESDKILGVTMIFDEAPEVIQLFSLLMDKGITKSELDNQAGIHPTISEEIFSLAKL